MDPTDPGIMVRFERIAAIRPWQVIHVGDVFGPASDWLEMERKQPGIVGSVVRTAALIERQRKAESGAEPTAPHAA